MSLERTREFLLTLPRVAETLQWEHNLVFWVMDKAVGGKMFAMIDADGPADGDNGHVMGFAVPPERFHELLETEGVRPAPYLARAHWVVIDDSSVFPAKVLQEHLQAAYNRVAAKLPRREQRVLELNDREYKALVRERRAALKAEAKR